MSFWDSLTIDDLPNEDLKWVANTLGLDVAKRIWKKFAGNHFDKPVHQLAFETGVSERTIYRYMNFVEKKPEHSGQLSLF